jgi:hypothetical protein
MSMFVVGTDLYVHVLFWLQLEALDRLVRIQEAYIADLENQAQAASMESEGGVGDGGLPPSPAALAAIAEAESTAALAEATAVEAFEKAKAAAIRTEEAENQAVEAESRSQQLQQQVDSLSDDLKQQKQKVVELAKLFAQLTLLKHYC